MMFPSNATKMTVENATVEFLSYQENGIDYIGFDTSMCIPPEPMINAMLALELLTSAHKKVVMINHRSPVGLLAKIGNFYDIETTDLEDGKIKLVFSYKEGVSDKADLSKKQCAG